MHQAVFFKKRNFQTKSTESITWFWLKYSFLGRVGHCSSHGLYHRTSMTPICFHNLSIIWKEQYSDFSLVQILWRIPFFAQRRGTMWRMIAFNFDTLLLTFSIGETRYLKDRMELMHSNSSRKAQKEERKWYLTRSAIWRGRFMNELFVLQRQWYSQNSLRIANRKRCYMKAPWTNFWSSLGVVSAVKQNDSTSSDNYLTVTWKNEINYSYYQGSKLISAIRGRWGLD